MSLEPAGAARSNDAPGSPFTPLWAKVNFPKWGFSGQQPTERSGQQPTVRSGQQSTAPLRKKEENLFKKRRPPDPLFQEINMEGERCKQLLLPLYCQLSLISPFTSAAMAPLFIILTFCRAAKTNFCANGSKPRNAGVVGTVGTRWFHARPRFRQSWFSLHGTKLK